MGVTIDLGSPLTQTYMAHSALLAIKLLALSPLATMTWVSKGIFSHPDVVRRAYLSELKNLAPFWIVGALYVTTCPSVEVGTSLFRMYTVARMVVVFGYAKKPVAAVFTDFAIVASFAITFYMAMYVVMFYRTAV